MTLTRATAFRLAVVGVAWLAVLTPVRAADPTADELANQVHEVFRKYCAECHGGGKKIRADLNLLNPASLLRADRPIVRLNEPDGSELLQLVECGTMPPGTRPKVPEKERAILRAWIKQGARPFPPEYSDAYVLTKILTDVRAAADKRESGRNLADERYVTLNHLLIAEDSTVDLDVYRAALCKALNQLSTSTKPGLVALKPIDPTATIFRIKLSDFGWHVRPFGADPRNAGKDIDPLNVNLYDLLLLDYPLASLPERTEAAEGVVAEYLVKMKMVRPIPFVRGDWLATVATEAPLYNDMLRLPLTIAELEHRLKLGNNVVAQRAAFTNSAVVQGNRIVERRSEKNQDPAYWRTYDLAGKRGAEALAADAEKKTGSGEAIFRLPNGLPGYFIADNRGVSLDAMPPANLREPLAKDEIRIAKGKDKVRNGLSCMICHDRGLIKVKNEIKVLNDLYPGDDKLGNLLDEDNKGIGEALRQTLQGFTDREPLGVVARRFRQEMTQLSAPPDMMAVNLDDNPRKSSLLDATYSVGKRGSPIRTVTRGGTNLTRPMPPLDGSGLLQIEEKDTGVSFDLMTINEDTKKRATRFAGGDHMAIVVKNTGKKTLYFEAFMTSEFGDMRRLPFAEGNAPLGQCDLEKEYRYNFEGLPIDAPKPGELTKQRVLVYAATEKFPPGVLLNRPDDKREPGYGVAGRVVHPLYQLDGNKIVARFDPAKIVRKTIEFETLVK